MVVSGLLIVFSTNASNVDSLYDAANRMDNTPEKVTLLLDLSDQVVITDQQRALKLAQQAQGVASKINDKKGIGRASYQELLSYYFLADMNAVQELSETTISLLKEVNNQFYIAKTYHILGKAQSFKGRFTEAERSILKGLEIFQALKDDVWIADSYAAMGLIFCQNGHYEEAIPIIEKSIEAYVGDTIKNARSLIRSNILLGVAYDGVGKYEEALLFNKKALAIAKREDDLYNITVATTNLGWIYTMLDDIQNALTNCEEGLKLAEQQNDNYSQTHNYKCLGKCYLKLEQFAQSDEYLKRGLDIARAKEIQYEEQNLLLLLSDLYKAQNKHQGALEYYQQYHAISDTILERKHLEAVEALKVDFNTEEASEDMMTANEKKRLKSNIRWLVALLLLLLLVSVVVIAFSIRIQIENTNRLTAKEAQHRLVKERFRQDLKMIHRLSGNHLTQEMRNILSFAGLMKRKFNTKKTDALTLNADDVKTLSEYTNIIYDGAEQMNFAIKSLSEFANIETEALSINKFDLSKVTAKLKKAFGNAIDNNQIVISFEEMPQFIATNAEALFIIFNNLIEHSINSNRAATPSVNIHYQQNPHEHQFIFVDNGTEWSENDLNSLVLQTVENNDMEVPDSQLNLGLLIARRFVEALEGNIQIATNEAINTQLIISLPLDQDQDY